MGGSVKLDKAGMKVFTDKCHFFNITSGYWYELENMTKAKEVDGALIGNKVYLIGDYTEELYSKTPSPGLFAIDLDEMARTKVVESKNLKEL
ncbi:hypothetical protein D2V93_15585 [Flagellimonas taeanensis]|uniref:hypothetical protein n=2 Tax=Flavobacteriales TaxID=200644 RepID=UPI000E6A8E8C|nr:hypothetical protein [Allomuricauda taeanensis]MDC6383812.1 hypothetical protein [Muricauda sp. SK9]RIV48438.1 hypothetical protein D2V93_15585 [Allomuricauda taeanensis]